MKEQFVPYELSMKLKELGFNERCLHIWKYNSMITMIEEEKKKDSEYAKWATSEGLAKYVLSDWHSGTLVPLFTKQDQCLAPLWQQAFDWCLEITNYKTIPNIYKTLDDKYYCNGLNSETLYEAKTKFLEKLIELVENENTSS